MAVTLNNLVTYR